MNRLTLVLALLLAPVSVHAQESGPAPIFLPVSAPVPSDAGLLTLAIDASVLADLPTSDNLYQFLETTQPPVISDRFSGGGLFAGQAARVGGFFGSSSQTHFRIGDVSVVDPTGSGAPLAFPDLALWQRIRVTSRMVPLDINSGGLAIALDPLQPRDTWHRDFFLSTSTGSSVPSTEAPSIARLGGWNRLSATASGPLVPGKLAGAFAATWNRTSEFRRADVDTVPTEQGSALANLVFTLSRSTEIRALGWMQRTTAPSTLRVPLGLPDAVTGDESGHAQFTWDHHPEHGRGYRLFGGYTQRTRTPQALTSPRIVFERLTDGPIEEIVRAGSSTVSQWTAGAKTVPASSSEVRFTFEAGAEIGGSGIQSRSPFSGPVGELVNGLPARVWVFSQPESASHRTMLTTSAYVDARIQLAPSFQVNAGVAFDMASGSARDAATDISWQTPLPQASMRWAITDTWRLAAFAGIDRSAYRLPLDLLTIGDPQSPVADVYRWDAVAGALPPLSARGPLVSRAGPGSGPNGTLNTVDPSLKRPYTDELTIGFEAQPVNGLMVRFAGMKRRERNLLGLLNTGVPVSAYSIVGFPDVGIDVATSADDGIVNAYNRGPDSFGRDSYLLTNPEQDDATSESIEVSIQLTKQNVLFFLGGTASRTDGPAASRGYGPLENDEALTGELFTTPNATSLARGRLFNDRAYTGKVVTVFKMPARFRLGLLMRYQDGQPFARVIVVPALNQGAEAVRAFANGGHRFMFTGTVDARLQKTLSIGRFTTDLVFDAYNLPNMSNEVEEDIVTGPAFRTVTAVQPSRTFHLGLRVSF